MKPKPQKIEKPLIQIHPCNDATLFELVKAAHNLGFELHIVLTEKSKIIKKKPSKVSK